MDKKKQKSKKQLKSKKVTNSAKIKTLNQSQFLTMLNKTG